MKTRLKLLSLIFLILELALHKEIIQIKTYKNDINKLKKVLNLK